MPAFQFDELNQKLSDVFRPWQRSLHFWVRAADIYVGYKVCQGRVRFVKSVDKQEAMWEAQHELAAEKVYSLCSELGGFFLKAAQIIGKPDLAPTAWVRRLVTLCDRAPATPFHTVQLILEKELGQNIAELFERFDEEPVGSASIAQVHRARIKGSMTDVAVKVQHPGIQKLMLTDIRNLQALAIFLQKFDIKFDLLSFAKEIEKQCGELVLTSCSIRVDSKVGYEFDFLREADAMERIRHFLHRNNKKVPVLVPHVNHNFVTRNVLVMDFIDGTPILNLGIEMAKRGINADSKLAAAAKQKILHSITAAYGQMILKSGFFHADPHPGNILICKDLEVALLDYGQVKHLPDSLRLAYASLILAMADNDPVRTGKGFKQLGIETFSMCKDEQRELLKLSKIMFDTKFPAGISVMSPFEEDASIRKIGVQTFPEELFSVLRTVQLLRGLAAGLGINYSCAELWRSVAEAALHDKRPELGSIEEKIEEQLQS